MNGKHFHKLLIFPAGLQQEEGKEMHAGTRNFQAYLQTLLSRMHSVCLLSPECDASEDVCRALGLPERRFSAPEKMLTVGTDMTHCFKECLMPLEIDNLSSFICKMSACQVVSRRQATEDTAAHVSSLAATKLQMRCGRADSPSLHGISNHL